MPSPMYVFGAIFMKSFTTSNLMSGASMALGLRANCWGVSWSGGVRTNGIWASRVEAEAEIASAAATRLKRVFIGHLWKQWSNVAPNTARTNTRRRFWRVDERTIKAATRPERPRAED